MTVFNRRNALVGYLALRGIPRYRRRKERVQRGLKIALFVTLAVVSAGILAAVAAAFLKAKKSEPQHLEGYAAAEDVEEIADEVGAEAASAESGPAIAEPIPAT